jgi:ATP-dependent RNA helicase DHX8/PRP22
LSGSKNTSRKRELEYKNLPDGMGLGDHIQLLQIYEQWRHVGYDFEWCKQHGLQVLVSQTLALYMVPVLHSVSYILFMNLMVESSNQERSMIFAKEVRKQLSAIMQDKVKGTLCGLMFSMLKVTVNRSM